MRSPGSLSLKISISILSAVFLIFTAIILYNYIISRNLLLKNVEENINNLAVSKALKIEKMLESTAKVPENLSSILGSGDFDLKDIQTYLKLVVEYNPEVFGSCIAFEPYVFDPDSQYYAPYAYRKGDGIAFKYLNSRKMDYFSQAWYKLPADQAKAIWTEPYFDEGGGNVLMCTYSVPIFDLKDENRFIGVVTIDLSLDWLKDFVESIKVYKNGYAFLISAEGTIITQSVENASENQDIFQIATERQYDVLHQAGLDMIHGGSDFIPFESPLIDGKSWLLYTPVRSAGWSLSIILPEAEFMSDLNILNRDLLIIGVLGFIILFLIVVFISRRITKPLTKLSDAARQIGQGHFDLPLPASKSQDEIGQLNDSIRKMQAELKSYIKNLQETTAAKEKIESEIQIARDIQQGIIPKIFPAFPERENLDLFAILEPARDVGGDLYDFFFIDNDHLCFTIGDVSGKGVPASLFMAITRTLLRARMDINTSVNEVIEAMNNELCIENDNAMFVTLFLGILNVETGEIKYCNAGHNYPYIIKAGGKVEEIKGTHGTPLGAVPDIAFGSTSIQLENNDTLMLYTDGVSEAIDVDENQYTEARIMSKLAELNDAGSKTIIKSLYEDLNTFVGKADQFDDITMLVLKWNKKNG